MHDATMTTNFITIPTIDAQVHTYERDHPGRPWIGSLQGPPEVIGDDMVAAMDTVGVDGALLVSPWSMYRYDASYALEVYARHPGRFGLIKPIDPQADDIAEQISQWATTPGAVGARIVLLGGAQYNEDDHGLNSLLAAGAKHNLPINILCWEQLALFEGLARRNPNTQMVLDHLGLKQPFEPPAPSDPFLELDAVIALAQYDNVVIKITGACTLSHRPFPYDDLWKPLSKIFDAFGIDRCMWGTDWTRAVELLTYKQGVEAFRLIDQLSKPECAALMGGTLTRIYRWSPAEGKSGLK